MNTDKHFFRMGLLAVTLLVTASCGQTNSGDASLESTPENAPEIVLKDYGNAPTVLDIEAYTVGNENFRTTLWTGTNLQVTLMTIPVGGDIGLELHPDIDQFLRIEQGEGRVLMGDAEDKLDFVQEVKADYSVFVPAGKWHNLVRVMSQSNCIRFMLPLSTRTAQFIRPKPKQWKLNMRMRPRSRFVYIWLFHALLLFL